MPPGTGDVPLSVFQSVPLDGIVIVTSPQDLVSMVVEKAVKMAEKMDIPIVGLVENMSYLVCPDCGRKIYLFGEGKSEEAAKKYAGDAAAIANTDKTLTVANAAADAAATGVRIKLLEMVHGTDVSGISFVSAFDTLDVVALEGVWNKPMCRVEF